MALPGVLTNDSDVDGDALSAVLVAGPAHGTVTLADDGSFTYTPDPGSDPGAPPSDAFTYQVNPARIVFGPHRRPETITASLILGTSLAIRIEPAQAAAS